MEGNHTDSPVKCTVFIIIIMSCHYHRFPWLSFAIRHYYPLHSAGPLFYILCLNRAVVDKFQPDIQHLLVYERVHKRILLMNSLLLLKQCPVCLVHLIRIVLEMGGRWPYCCCFMGCCFQDLFRIAHSIVFIGNPFEMRLLNLRIFY